MDLTDRGRTEINSDVTNTRYPVHNGRRRVEVLFVKQTIPSIGSNKISDDVGIVDVVRNCVPSLSFTNNLLIYSLTYLSTPTGHL